MRREQQLFAACWEACPGGPAYTLSHLWCQRCTRHTLPQVELAAAGVSDPAAALSDLRYACHETGATLLTLLDHQLEAQGQGGE